MVGQWPSEIVPRYGHPARLIETADRSDAILGLWPVSISPCRGGEKHVGR